jgi:hypothetical protein
LKSTALSAVACEAVIMANISIIIIFFIRAVLLSFLSLLFHLGFSLQRGPADENMYPFGSS